MSINEDEEIKKSIQEWKREIEELRSVKRPKELEDEVRKQFAPLFTDYHTVSSKFKIHDPLFNPTFLEKSLKAYKFVKLQSGLLEIFNKDCSNDFIEGENEYRTLLAAMFYLTEVELIGNAYVDETILLLVTSSSNLKTNGKLWKFRQITSLKDLESPSFPLSKKLDFLKANGLPFFLKWIDRRLRNKIAHLDFKINKGSFMAGKTVDLMQKVQTFNDYYNCVNLVFSEEQLKSLL